MQFKASIIGAAAFALSVAAQSSSVLFTKAPTSVQAGQSYNIGYSVSDKSKPVTILLRKGKSTDLKTISVLTSSSTGGSYTWTPSESLANDSDYALEIKQGAEVNYSGQFSLSGGSAGGSKKQPSSPKPNPPSYEKPEKNEKPEENEKPSMVTSAPTAYRSTEAPSKGGYGASSVAGCVASKIGDNQVQYPAYCSSLATSAKVSATPVPPPSYHPVNNTSTYSPSKPSQPSHPVVAAPPAPPAKNNTYPPPKAAPTSGGGQAPAGTSSGPAATSTGGASTIGSSLALVMGAVAAFAFIN